MEYSDERIRRAYDEFLGGKNIEERCTEESLVRLHEAFLVTENEEMTESQLRDAFERVLGIEMPDEEFNVLFRKINLNNDGKVSWDEMVSYLLLEFQEKDTALRSRVLELPITGTAEIIGSHHRTPICRITFCPEVLPDRGTSFERGSYLTVSRDGVLNFWSLDLSYERTVRSVNPYLKVQPTVITDMIVMPDVQIVCVSSTEYDLRFYDIAAKKFDLRMLISRFDYAIACMAYHFDKDIGQDSHVVLGDVNGGVRILSFNGTDRGPFKQEPGRDVITFRYETLLRGELNGMRVTEIRNVHTNWVNQVAYYGSLKAFMSCSRCPGCSLLFSDPTGTRMRYKFRVNLGIQCFTFCEQSQILVTGGADCIVRVWNPFVTRRANIIFQGHHATICGLVVQNNGKRIYSLSKDKCVKVWDVLAQSCIQTYSGLPAELGEHTAISFVYNSLNHKMIMAGMVIAVITFERVVNEEVSDGFTHTRPVSCVLYNHLYEVIVTAGYNSCIIVWDPWLGRRLYLITNAHSRLVHGQHHQIEITAACFDDSEQLLITGARDGSLKIWNFHTGTCLRRMIVENQCEITSIVYLENRILCSGWNRQVVEFAASGTDMCRKTWGLRHTEDILCSAMRYPQILATATYNGELILWRLETGQPFRKYKVDDVTARYNITESTRRSTGRARTNGSDGPRAEGRSRRSTNNEESALGIVRTVAVRAILFLNSRTAGPNTGTLLISLDSGLVQVWSHHPAGGFLEAFSVVHANGDCGLSLATDPENYFLVTGHKIGYIKVWLLAGYLVPERPEISAPILRLEFPFLWRDRVLGRAKRAVRDQPLPLLLSSLRGHTGAVTTLQIIPRARLIVSGSADRTVRLWTYGGCYIATLGTFREWPPILPGVPARQYYKRFRCPPDIERSASFTTRRVLNGGFEATETERAQDESDRSQAEERKTVAQRARITRSIVNRFLGTSKEPLDKNKPVLDTTLPYIPIYAHLNVKPFDTSDDPFLQNRRETA